jgi:2-keto-4-pentenoate hydratase/2-oxohepta-3-ene-1,7-dioic acid hydratase in catechol pathway
MRLCRYSHLSAIAVGLYFDDGVIPLREVARLTGDTLLQSELDKQPDCMERLLSPSGDLSQQLRHCFDAIENFQRIPKVSTSEIEVLPPIAAPSKLLLLAGNYVEHILEQGDLAAERANTFPYVFMKPAGTTLRGNRASVAIPSISPNKIDYELELAVIIGKEARNVSADQALNYVAGYTIINDLSDRGFRPNPSRQERPRDKFFDWLHGKWHDGFCPCGPCITTADEIPDPQALKMTLSVDGKTRQDASTSLQVFSVAEVISFISSMMTLSPGDIISTGTPSGVGNATGNYLKAGQRIEATIEKIGTLVTTMVADRK